MMNSPYRVLGVSPQATDDEIKKAYRSLSRKYHPDANVNNPQKAQAEARFKEIQQAYSQIMDQRTNGYSDYDQNGRYGGFGGFGGFGYEQNRSTQQESQSDLHLRAAANYLQAGRFQEALHVLEGIEQRSGLWYFLAASANSGMGQQSLALQYAQEAVRLEPGNMQYTMLLQRLQNGGGWYQSRQAGYGFPTAGGSNCCTQICIANLVCNLCCGGGALCCR